MNLKEREKQLEQVDNYTTFAIHLLFFSHMGFLFIRHIFLKYLLMCFQKQLCFSIKKQKKYTASIQNSHVEIILAPINLVTS